MAAQEGHFIRVEPMVRYFKMVAQLGESDVEVEGYFVRVGSVGRYFKRLAWLRERGFERVGLGTGEMVEP